MRYTHAGGFPGTRRGGGTVDTGDLKSPTPQGVCEFKSRPRHRADPCGSGAPAGYLVDHRAHVAAGPGALVPGALMARSLVTGRVAAAGVGPWCARALSLAALRRIATGALTASGWRGRRT